MFVYLCNSRDSLKEKQASSHLLVPVLMLNDCVLVSLPLAVLANVGGKVPTEQGPAKSKSFIIHSIFWMQNFLIIALCLHYRSLFN